MKKKLIMSAAVGALLVSGALAQSPNSPRVLVRRQFSRVLPNRRQAPARQIS